jgi:hypothetical protein
VECIFEAHRWVNEMDSEADCGVYMSVGGLEHLKTETRLTDTRFVNVMGGCDFRIYESHL